MGLFDNFKKKKQSSESDEQVKQDCECGFFWKDIEEILLNSANNIKIHKKLDASALSVPYKTPMEALVNSVDYIEVNYYLRILGTGNSKYENMLEFTKYYKEIFGDDRYIIAHDVFGGLFATAGTICYLAPDALEWVDLGVNYQRFINWTATQGVNDFYKDFLWKDAEKICCLNAMWMKEF